MVLNIRRGKGGGVTGGTFSPVGDLYFYHFMDLYLYFYRSIFYNRSIFSESVFSVFICSGSIFSRVPMIRPKFLLRKLRPKN